MDDTPCLGGYGAFERFGQEELAYQGFCVGAQGCLLSPCCGHGKLQKVRNHFVQESKLKRTIFNRYGFYSTIWNFFI
jgi:hypothetical protein